MLRNNVSPREINSRRVHAHSVADRHRLLQTNSFNANTLLAREPFLPRTSMESAMTSESRFEGKSATDRNRDTVTGHDPGYRQTRFFPARSNTSSNFSPRSSRIPCSNRVVRNTRDFLHRLVSVRQPMTVTLSGFGVRANSFVGETPRGRRFLLCRCRRELARRCIMTENDCASISLEITRRRENLFKAR